MTAFYRRSELALLICGLMLLCVVSTVKAVPNGYTIRSATCGQNDINCTWCISRVVLGLSSGNWNCYVMSCTSGTTVFKACQQVTSPLEECLQTEFLVGVTCDDCTSFYCYPIEDGKCPTSPYPPQPIVHVRSRADSMMIRCTM